MGIVEEKTMFIITPFWTLHLLYWTWQTSFQAADLTRKLCRICYNSGLLRDDIPLCRKEANFGREILFGKKLKSPAGKREAGCFVPVLTIIGQKHNDTRSLLGEQC